MSGVGSFPSLPSDAQAASLVHRSSWELRPDNYTANHTVPTAGFLTAGYSGMQNHAQLFGRVTGNFTGTTDEIIQWAAAKWGLPDDLIRAEAVVKSSGYQNLKDGNGKPIANSGYGDFGSCGGSPAPSGYGTTGPASFGITQIKWCAHKDASAPGYGTWPWSERSTAYNLDYFGAVMRGCVEGWDSWLANGYAAGDMWGCVGRWFAGEWHSTAANNYITTVKNAYNAKPWLAGTSGGNPTPTPSPTPDTTPPAVTISAPAEGERIYRFVRIVASAQDNVGVVKMELYINGNLRTTSTSGDISFGWTSKWARRGQHVITIKAYDAAGNVATQTRNVVH